VRRIWAAAAAVLVLAPTAPALAGAVGLRFVHRDDSGIRQRATLRCDGRGQRATGYLSARDPARLCQRAYQLERFLGRPPDGDRACTEVYGGPDRVRVRGNVRGTGVDRRFALRDGCEIADWERAALLLPRREGDRASRRARLLMAALRW